MVSCLLPRPGTCWTPAPPHCYAHRPAPSVRALVSWCRGCESWAPSGGCMSCCTTSTAPHCATRSRRLAALFHTRQCVMEVTHGGNRSCQSDHFGCMHARVMEGVGTAHAGTIEPDRGLPGYQPGCLHGPPRYRPSVGEADEQPLQLDLGGPSQRQRMRIVPTSLYLASSSRRCTPGTAQFQRC